MKNFVFAFETVLEARRRQEDEARQQLAVALENYRAALACSQEADEALEHFFSAIAHASSGAFSVANRESLNSMQRAQMVICQRLKKEAEDFAAVAETKRAAVVAARRNRELLEKIKTQRRKNWEREAALAEQHLFDEFAMTRRHQASLKEKTLC
jgi:flagellar export protein FliJ